MGEWDTGLGWLVVAILAAGLPLPAEPTGPPGTPNPVAGKPPGPGAPVPCRPVWPPGEPPSLNL